MSVRLLALHGLSFGILVSFFGSTFHSSGADVSHFTFISALMSDGASGMQAAPHVELFRFYPPLSHWMAAGLGYILGSGFVAMWFICIASMYGCYYSLSRLVAFDGRQINLLIFVTSIALGLQSRAIVGFETISNFFYPQQVGTAIYLIAMLAISGMVRLSVWARISLAFLSVGVLLRIHMLPALHFLSAFGILLVVEMLLEFQRVRRVDTRIASAFGVFVAGGLALLAQSPWTRNTIEISAQGGVLDFGIQENLIWVLGASGLALTGWRIWRQSEAGETIIGDRFVFAALGAAVGLAFAQLLALRLFGLGSSYAVSKHLFLMLTLSLVAFSRWPNWQRLRWSGIVDGRFPSALVSAGTAIVICALLLNRPGDSLYPIVRTIDYAQHAAKYGLPKLSPGNTAVFAGTVSPVIRYVTSVAAFHYTIGSEVASALLDGSFDPRSHASFVMVDSAPWIDAQCEERYAETNLFVVIPVRCLSSVSKAPLDGTLSFVAGGVGDFYRTGEWWPSENWGTWGKPGKSSVTIVLPSGLQSSSVEISLSANAFLPTQKPTLTVDISVNDRPLTTWTMTRGDEDFSFMVPSDLTKASQLKISFIPRDPISPRSVGYNSDARVLGLGLKTLAVRGVQSK